MERLLEEAMKSRKQVELVCLFYCYFCFKPHPQSLESNLGKRVKLENHGSLGTEGVPGLTRPPGQHNTGGWILLILETPNFM